MRQHLFDGGLPSRFHVGQPLRRRQVMLGKSHSVDGDQRKLRRVLPGTRRQLPVIGAAVAMASDEFRKELVERGSVRHRFQPCREARGAGLERRSQRRTAAHNL
jgi:hypothetical protein